MRKENSKNLYSDEISLLAEEGSEDYVQLNLRRIQAQRLKFDIPVIGIAGAEGKTTTKRMLSAILSKSNNILETPPNCSSTSGVTETLLKLDKSHKLAILELGIVEPEQFIKAVKVSRPNIAVVTNIGEAHLASMGDKFLIADVKTELVRKLPKDGCAILNIDDDLVSALANFSPTPRVIKFGLNPNAHFYANKIQYLGPEGIVFYVNSYYPFHLPIFSSTSIYNALTAISVARYLGVDFADIQFGLEHKFSLLPHRGNLLKKNGVYILDYTYDATINSVNRACESLVQFKPYSQQLILVIGDLSNPGPKKKQAHLKIGYYIAALPIHTIITIGEDAKYIAEGVKRMNYSNKTVKSVRHNDELIQILPDFLTPDATVLFIGSKDLKLSKPMNEIFGMTDVEK